MDLDAGQCLAIMEAIIEIIDSLGGSSLVQIEHVEGDDLETVPWFCIKKKKVDLA